MAALADDLRRYREGEPVLARPDSFAYRARKYVLRNKLVVGSGTAVVLALSGGLGVATWQYRQAVEQARIAREEAKTSAAVQGFMEDIFTANSTDQTDPAKARKTTARNSSTSPARRWKGRCSSAAQGPAANAERAERPLHPAGLGGQGVTTAKLALDLIQGPASRFRIGSTAWRGTSGHSATLGKATQRATSGKRGGSAGQGERHQRSAGARTDRDGSGQPRLREEPFGRGVQPYRAGDSSLLRAAGDKGLLVEALTLQAVIAGHVNGREQLALSALLEAKALAEGEGGRLNGSLMQIYGQLSEVSTRLDDPAGAVGYARHAFALAQAAHTPDEDMARYESRAVAKALSFAGRPVEALEFLDKAWQLSDPSRPEIKSFIQYGLLIRWGVVQVEAGRAEAALLTDGGRLRRLREAMPELKGNPQETVIRVAALRELGQLDAADAAWQTLMRNAPPEINAARLGWVSVAEMNLSRANAARAKAAVLDAVSHETVGTSQGPRLEVDVFLARVALMEGQLDEVDRLTRQALKEIEAFVQRSALADLEAQMLWIRSRMLLERHDAATALPLAQRAVGTLRSRGRPDGQPEAGARLGSLAQAQFMTGHAHQARETFGRMRTIDASSTRMSARRCAPSWQAWPGNSRRDPEPEVRFQVSGQDGLMIAARSLAAAGAAAMALAAETLNLADASDARRQRTILGGYILGPAPGCGKDGGEGLPDARVANDRWSVKDFDLLDEFRCHHRHRLERGRPTAVAMP